MSRDTLLIIGAGPKALALAAKAAVLREVGITVPKIRIIERNGLGAQWTGLHGYTDGSQPLGTPPEKDIGFPYASSQWGRRNEDVNRRMQRYSWQSFLVAHHQWSKWIDYGRPAPTHREWASYLAWVGHSLPEKIKYAEVVSIDSVGDLWELTTRDERGAEDRVTGNGLVVTGPGPAVSLQGQPTHHPRVLTGLDFWRRPDDAEALRGKRVALIGTGETAGTIGVALLSRFGTDVELHVIGPAPLTSERAETFSENQVYSDPQEWARWSTEARQAFIARTDRGVMSSNPKRVLEKFPNVQPRPAWISRMDASDGGVGLTFSTAGKDNHQQEMFDYVIVAVGFDSLWFRGLLTPRAKSRIQDRCGRITSENVGRAVDIHLALAELRPRLHVPMLAGPAQGPGYPNLSCLGRLSDQILAAYSRRSAPPMVRFMEALTRIPRVFDLRARPPAGRLT